MGARLVIQSWQVSWWISNRLQRICRNQENKWVRTERSSLSSLREKNWERKKIKNWRGLNKFLLTLKALVVARYKSHIRSAQQQLLTWNFKTHDASLQSNQIVRLTNLQTWEKKTTGHFECHNRNEIFVSSVTKNEFLWFHWKWEKRTRREHESEIHMQLYARNVQFKWTKSQLQLQHSNEIRNKGNTLRNFCRFYFSFHVELS